MDISAALKSSIEISLLDEILRSTYSSFRVKRDTKESCDLDISRNTQGSPTHTPNNVTKMTICTGKKNPRIRDTIHTEKGR